MDHHHSHLVFNLSGSSGINDEENDGGFVTIQHVLDVTEDKTIAGSTSSTVTTKRKAVVVAATKSLILGPDCELVINTYRHINTIKSWS